jgi:hypothetical protein
MREDGKIDGSAARELIEAIKREFEGVDRPVTAYEIARLYGVIAAQHEANLAVYSLAMKANPKLIFSDNATNAQEAIRASATALTGALRDLAISSMSDEELAKLGADDDET